MEAVDSRSSLDMEDSSSWDVLLCPPHATVGVEVEPPEDCYAPYEEISVEEGVHLRPPHPTAAVKTEPPEDRHARYEQVSVEEDVAFKVETSYEPLDVDRRDPTTYEFTEGSFVDVSPDTNSRHVDEDGIPTGTVFVDVGVLRVKEEPLDVSSNTDSHETEISTEFLATCVGGTNIKTEPLDNTATSPDTNPMENLCANINITVKEEPGGTSFCDLPTNVVASEALFVDVGANCHRTDVDTRIHDVKVTPHLDSADPLRSDPTSPPGEIPATMSLPRKTAAPVFLCSGCGTGFSSSAFRRHHQRRCRKFRSETDRRGDRPEATTDVEIERESSADEGPDARTSESTGHGERKRETPPGVESDTSVDDDVDRRRADDGRGAQDRRPQNGRVLTRACTNAEHGICKPRERRYFSNFCDVCKVGFASRNNLVKHRRAHSEKTSHVCDTCGESFVSVETLADHRRIHHETGVVRESHDTDRPYVCDLCPAGFKKRSNLTRHIRTHSGEKPYSCEFCDATFNQRFHLNEHRLTHSDERPHVCPSCGARFKYSTNLKRHNRIHTANKSHACEHCGASFSQRSSLTFHLRTHADAGRHECDLCSATFGHRSALTTHRCSHTGELPYTSDFSNATFLLPRPTVARRTDSTRRDFVCDLCGAAFERRGQLNQHKRTHKTEKPFACEICRETFTLASSLRRHRRIHSVEKPHSCDRCEASFTHREYLVRHLRTHVGTKPFVCEVCHVGFTERFNLTRHKRTHTGDKLFICDECQATFTFHAYLIRHKRRHAGDKPFKCEICQDRFNDSSNLAKHKKIHAKQNSFTCNFCDASFTQRCRLTRHKKIHDTCIPPTETVWIKETE